MSFFATSSSKMQLIQSVRKMFDLKFKYIRSKAFPTIAAMSQSSFIETKQYNLSERK